MKDFNRIGEDLFNKLRGRFQSMTIGSEDGNVTNEPKDARFFDFDYTESGETLGKVSVSISEDDGLTVIYSRDFIQNEDEMTQDNWYNFLRELRRFSKKRLLNFDVRDINKTNLTKRDYKFLATTRPEDTNMTESKLYGTGRISYQKIDNARMVIKHTESIDQAVQSSRTRKIGSIYIESAEGERFRYPFKHLSGARAMARHVAEGGKPYDEFGNHIVGLSEEMSKLRKFNQYMGRSAVMAEGLEGYMDIVKERISVVKKTIENLQKPAFYKETFEAFEIPMFEDVPDDVKENWIDELTIKQFNEELADVFPYIYKLVGEATRTKSLGPDDLLGEAAGCPCNDLAGGKCTCPKDCKDCNCNDTVKEADDPCWKNYKQVGMKDKGGRKVPNCVPEEAELERGFDEMMGQFAEAKDVNFTADDLLQLQKLNNVDEVKRRAIELISTNSRKPMKPEKVAWFKQAIASKRTPMDVIKLMYDLMLSGDGNAVIGSRNSMSGNSYRKSFGEDGDLEEAAVPPGYTMARIIKRKVSSGQKRIGQMSGVDVKNAGKDSFNLVAIFGNYQDPLELTMKSAEYSTSVRSPEQFIKVAQRRLQDPLHKTNGIVLFFTDAEADSKTWAPYVDAIQELGDRKIQVSTRETRQSNGIGGKAGKVKSKDDDTGAWGSADAKKTAPEQTKTVVFRVENKKVVDFLKKKQPDYMMKYYKPATNEFVMKEKTFEKFKSTINGPAWIKKFGESLIMINREKSFSEEEGKKEQQIPLGEFILSYFDRHSGQFPKGETAVLTMVEKDYGERFIEPAKAFIEQVNSKVAEMYGFRDSAMQEDDYELNDITRLSGLR